MKLLSNHEEIIHQLKEKMINLMIKTEHPVDIYLFDNGKYAELREYSDVITKVRLDDRYALMYRHNGIPVFDRYEIHNYLKDVKELAEYAKVSQVELIALTAEYYKCELKDVHIADCINYVYANNELMNNVLDTFADDYKMDPAYYGMAREIVEKYENTLDCNMER